MQYPPAPPAANTPIVVQGTQELPKPEPAFFQIQTLSPQVAPALQPQAISPQAEGRPLAYPSFLDSQGPAVCQNNLSLSA